MLYVGIVLITNGIYLMTEDVFDIKHFIKTKTLIRKKSFKSNPYYEFKVLLGVLSIVVGVFALLNYVYY